MSRVRIEQNKKLVNFRLMRAQLHQLEQAQKALGKTKTAIVEQALSIYFNLLRRDGVL